MNSNAKTSIFWIVLACVSVLVWQVVTSAKQRPAAMISFTEFVREVKEGKVQKTWINDEGEVRGLYKDGSPDLYTLIPPHYTAIYNVLQDNGVEVEIKRAGTGWVAVLFNAAPFILLIGFWIFMMRQMQGRNKEGGTCWACGRSGPAHPA